MAIINGDDNPNILNGMAGNDTINGFGGDDVLGGGGGGDVLNGDDGDDVLRGEGGDDLLRGGAGADTLDGGDGVNTATYYASASGVTVDLTTGAGTGGDAQGDTLVGIAVLTGSNTGGDTLTGDSVGNSLAGWGGADLLRGGAGNDWLVGGDGNDTLDGGDGVDTANYSNEAAGVTVDLSIGIGVGGDNQSDSLISIENVIGSLYGYDTLIGDSGANTLQGGGGNDLLRGGAGADYLHGGYGYLEMDTATYSDSASGVTIDLDAVDSPFGDNGTGAGGDAEGDILADIEIVIGSNFNDTLTGSSGANTLQGGGGNDLLRGGGGADKLFGGDGVDTATYYDSAVGVQAGPGTGGYGGDAEGDSLIDVENVTGSNVGGDLLVGNNGANVLSGWGGGDVLRGGAGADTLNGGIGVDSTSYHDSNAAVRVNLAAGTASGGSAQGDILASIESVNGSNFNDTLVGSSVGNALGGLAGRDTLTGGGGADSFIYKATSESAVGANADRITDFSHAQGDRIDLSSIDASVGVLGNGAFTFIGSGLYTGVAGQLRFAVTSPGVTTIAGDVNGDGASDFHIQLTGNLTLVAGDFVL